MKLWSGRFCSDTDQRANDFNSSLSFDMRLYRYDIAGSIAHARMLGKCGIISDQESVQIIRGLEGILEDIEKGKVSFCTDAEDIHMAIESLLTERIGEAGKKLHTGRSRNDQVALDTRMYVREEIMDTISLLKELMQVLLGMANAHLETVMPGYTHLQRAQPVTLAHHLAAYLEMFLRDIQRLLDAQKRTDVMPLGSGALAGTTYPLDRGMVARELGFSLVSRNSMDAVSDRDYVLETVSTLSILMMHLSRLSEEVILWTSSEFGFMTLSDAFSTGSSIMPQKKNPDMAELVRGKSARVTGNLMTLLAMMKSLPLAYNKDMQEDKPALFDSFDNVRMSLQVFTPMLGSAAFDKERMLLSAEGGFSNATDLADYLVKKGMPFRLAHETSGKIVAMCLGKNISLGEVPLETYREFSPLFDEDLYEEIHVLACVKKRALTGGPAPDTVKEHLDWIGEFLKEL
ncbi:MAG: argininosuccinate lyase [Clostridia bacterium]